MVKAVAELKMRGLSGPSGFYSTKTEEKRNMNGDEKAVLTLASYSYGFSLCLLVHNF